MGTEKFFKWGKYRRGLENVYENLEYSLGDKRNYSSTVCFFFIWYFTKRMQSDQ